MLEGLGEDLFDVRPDNRVSILIGGRRRIRREHCRVGRVMGDGDVGQFRVIGRRRRASRIPRLKTIRIHVVTSVLGDRIGEVPCVGQREVVRRIGQTNGVLIKQGSKGDRVRWGHSQRRGEDAREGRVVGPLNTILARIELSQRGVLGLVSEDHDGVGETEIEA